MGACTVAIKKRNTTGASRVRVVDVTLSASYAAGGDTLTAAQLELMTVDLLIAAPNSGLTFEYDHANQKLKAFYPTGSTVAAGTTIGDPIIKAGAVAVTGTGATGPFQAGRAREIDAVTNASTVTCRVMVWGDNPYI